MQACRCTAPDVSPPPPPEPEHADPDEAVAYWHGAEGVARRLSAVRASRTALLLFLEYQPHRLDTWLRDRLDAGGAAAAEAMEMVDDTLLDPVVWMNQQGLFHFDTHLANLLTDGQQVLVTDFGLATARDFALDDGERRFLDQHRLHDPAYAATKFVNFLVTELTGLTDPRVRDAYIAEHAWRPSTWASRPQPTPSRIATRQSRRLVCFL